MIHKKELKPKNLVTQSLKEFLMKIAHPDTHVDLYFLSMMVELSAKKKKNYHSVKTTFFLFFIHYEARKNNSQ
jgi:hypothetical protein